MSDRLNQLLAESSSPRLDPEPAEKFLAYLTLLQKWNARTNLTAIRDEEGILSRHFVESILCARTLPAGIATLLDFGSGAGFPGLPIAILRPEIQVTLAESRHKKAAFLREAIRTLALSNCHVHGARAEELATHFDAVTLRAVDRMEAAVPAAIPLLHPGGWLILLTTAPAAAALQDLASGHSTFAWSSPISIGKNTGRIVLHGHKIPFNP